VAEGRGDPLAPVGAALIEKRLDEEASRVADHRDEEEDLFPRLLAADRAACEALVGRLLEDHREMRKAWTRMRETLSRIAAGESASLDADEVGRFTSLYRRHIELEEDQLLPAAERLLDTSALADTGDAMAKRRGAPR